MTPRWFRISMFIFAAVWTGLGVWSLAEGKYGTAAYQLAFGSAWLLMALFRDKLPWVRSGKFEAVLERQRSEVHGQGAISFLPDPDSRSHSK